MGGDTVFLTGVDSERKKYNCSGASPAYSTQDTATNRLQTANKRIQSEALRCIPDAQQR